MLDKNAFDSRPSRESVRACDNATAALSRYSDRSLGAFNVLNDGTIADVRCSGNDSRVTSFRVTSFTELPLQWSGNSDLVDYFLPDFLFAAQYAFNFADNFARVAVLITVFLAAGLAETGFELRTFAHLAL